MLLRCQKPIAIVLILTLLLSSFFVLAGCAGKPKDGGQNEPNGREDDNSSKNEGQDGEQEELIKPDRREYDRPAVPFSEMVYERPDVWRAEEIADGLAADLSEETVSAETLKEKLNRLSGELEHIRTMKNFTELMLQKDGSLRFFSDEFDAITEAEISLHEKIAKMLGTFDASSYASALGDSAEMQRFRLTYHASSDDALGNLLQEENGLLSEVHSISKSNVTLTFNKETGTCETLLNLYRDRYGEGSGRYLSASNLILELYNEAVAERKFDVYVKLLKVRKKIAEACGVSSYAEVAYNAFGSESYHDYTPKQMKVMLDGIADYFVPVYEQLETLIFSPYFATATPYTGTLTNVRVMNRIYRYLEEKDADLLNVFSFLLQYELYDLGEKNENRSDENKTYYLEDYKAPYLFVTTDGSYGDYVHFAEQFGSFLDYYINGNAPISADYRATAESTLGLMTMVMAGDVISAESLTYLKYQTVRDRMREILEQALFARFEADVYDLPYEQITEEKVKQIFLKSAESFGFSSLTDETLPFLLNSALIDVPFSSQSKAVGDVCAFEIGLAYAEGGENKLDPYKILLTRNGQTKSLLNALNEGSILSPFESDAMRSISDDVFFYLTGYRFYLSLDLSPFAS